ncbi:hypothetical protein FRC12_004819 [Ceratobasidium sp. 428]|nr:hypothetical protein FRC12_004819 [Ceratobasidium sp. 428]
MKVKVSYYDDANLLAFVKEGREFPPESKTIYLENIRAGGTFLKRDWTPKGVDHVE